MKKVAFTYILAFITSILIVVFLHNYLSTMISAFFFLILLTMLICDIIVKKSLNEILVEGILIGVVAYFVLSKYNANPFSLIPALLCMSISIYRTFKLLEQL